MAESQIKKPGLTYTTVRIPSLTLPGSGYATITSYIPTDKQYLFAIVKNWSTLSSNENTALVVSSNMNFLFGKANLQITNLDISYFYLT